MMGYANERALQTYKCDILLHCACDCSSYQLKLCIKSKALPDSSQIYPAPQAHVPVLKAGCGDH